MAHDPSRLGVGETTQGRRLVRRVVGDVEDARLVVIFVVRGISHGAIETLRVKREMPKRQGGETGVFTSSNQQTESAVITVENTGNEAWPVRIRRARSVASYCQRSMKASPWDAAASGRSSLFASTLASRQFPRMRVQSHGQGCGSPQAASGVSNSAIKRNLHAMTILQRSASASK